MTTTLCPRTDRVMGTCWCDDCWPEVTGTATHRSLCGWCTGTIQQGDPVVRRTGETRWWHQSCAEAA